MFNRKKILIFYFLVFTFSLMLFFIVVTEEGSKYMMSIKFSSAYKYFYSGKLEKAMAICNDTLAREPHNYKVMELMGKIYLAMGKKEMAISYFRQAKNYAPEDVRIKISSFLEKLK